MKKYVLALASATLLGISCVPTATAYGVMAEGEETSIVSEETIASEESIISSEAEELVYRINGATINYRDSEDSPYVAGSDKIGSYYVSADGWKAEDTFDIYLNIKGNIVTKMESKVLYIYEYKPTVVIWNGAVIEQNADRTYTLTKPTAVGSYNIEIDFTKTIVTNPTDLTTLNWGSLLTVQNLMTIASWLVIVIGILVLYGINRRYKKRGSTTLEEVKKSLSAQIEESCGTEVAKVVSDVFDTTIKATFTAIEGKLEKVDANNATLVRCLLLMQENTPEARLAITKCLSELDTTADKKGDEVKALIEAEMKKYQEQAEAKAIALEEAKKSNEAWKDKASQSESSATSEAVGDGYDGTTI